ncbi:MAG: tetratricopeptide repeat protein [Methylococcaceae bacterium]
MDTINPKDLEQTLLLSKNLLQSGDIDNALEYIDLIIKNFPEEAQGYFLCAEAYLKKGMHEKAIEFLYTANSLDINNISYHGRLAEQLFFMDEFDAACEYYQNVLKLDPNLGWVYVGLGNILEKQGYIEQAIEYFQKALEIDPDNTELRSRLEQLQDNYTDNTLSAKTSVSLAVSNQQDITLNKYVPFDLGNPSINYVGFIDGIDNNILLGWALNKDELTTCQCMELIIEGKVVAKFITHTPRTDISGVLGTRTRYGFMFPLLDLLKPNDSFKDLLSSLENNKAVEYGVRFAGTHLFLRFPKNNNKINLALLLSDTSAKELDSANQAFHEGDTKKSLALYLEYLNEYPLNWLIHHRVADIYLHLKKYDATILHYNEALAINYNYCWSLHNLSLACYLSGNWRDALVYYQRLRKHEPLFWDDNKEDYTVQKHLACMLLHSNKEKEARKIFETIILAQENPWDRYLDLVIPIKKNTLQVNATKVLAETATLDDLLNLRVELRDFLFPPHSKQWRNLIAKIPITSAACSNAKGFLEAVSVCKLTKKAVVVGWTVATQDTILWFEDETGKTHSFNNAYHCFRRDVYELFVYEFGAAASNASVITLLDNIRAGSVIKLKTCSASGVHVLHEIETQELSANPIAAARWLFSVAVPIAKFHQRVPLIDRLIIEPLITHYEQLQKKLSVQVKQCGTALVKPIVSVIVPLYGRTDFVEHQLMEFANDPWFLEHAQLIYVLDDPKLVDEFAALAQNLHALYRVPFCWIWGNSNRGFSGANNLGADYANGQYLTFLNSDAFPQQAGWLPKLISVLKEHKDIGAVGPRLLFADNSIQHAGMSFMYNEELGIWVNHHPYSGLDPCLDPSKELSIMPAITGACLVMRRSDFERVAGWDTGYLIGDFEDSDLCLKLRDIGLKIAYLPSVQLTHLERQSFKIQGGDDFRTRLVLYNAVRHQTRWAKLLAPSAELV